MCKKTHFKRRLNAGEDVFNVKTPSKQKVYQIYIEKYEKKVKTSNSKKKEPVTIKDILPKYDRKVKIRTQSPDKKRSLVRIRRTFSKMPKDFVVAEEEHLEKSVNKIPVGEMSAKCEDEQTQVDERRRELARLTKLIEIKRRYNKQKRRLLNAVKQKKKHVKLFEGSKSLHGRIRKANVRLKDGFAMEKEDILQHEEYCKLHKQLLAMTKPKQETRLEKPTKRHPKSSSMIVIENWEAEDAIQAIAEKTPKPTPKPKSRQKPKRKSNVTFEKKQELLQNTEHEITQKRAQLSKKKPDNDILVLKVPEDHRLINAAIMEDRIMIPTKTQSLKADGSAIETKHCEKSDMHHAMIKQEPVDESYNDAQKSHEMSQNTQEKFKKFKIPENVQKLFENNSQVTNDGNNMFIVPRTDAVYVQVSKPISKSDTASVQNGVKWTNANPKPATQYVHFSATQANPQANIRTLSNLHSNVPRSVQAFIPQTTATYRPNMETPAYNQLTSLLSRPQQLIVQGDPISSPPPIQALLKTPLSPQVLTLTAPRHTTSGARTNSMDSSRNNPQYVSKNLKGANGFEQATIYVNTSQSLLTKPCTTTTRFIAPQSKTVGSSVSTPSNTGPMTAPSPRPVNVIFPHTIGLNTVFGPTGKPVDRVRPQVPASKVMTKTVLPATVVPIFSQSNAARSGSHQSGAVKIIYSKSTQAVTALSSTMTASMVLPRPLPTAAPANVQSSPASATASVLTGLPGNGLPSDADKVKFFLLKIDGKNILIPTDVANQINPKAIVMSAPLSTPVSQATTAQTTSASGSTITLVKETGPRVLQASTGVAHESKAHPRKVVHVSPKQQTLVTLPSNVLFNTKPTASIVPSQKLATTQTPSVVKHTVVTNPGVGRLATPVYLRVSNSPVKGSHTLLRHQLAQHIKENGQKHCVENKTEPQTQIAMTIANAGIPQTQTVIKASHETTEVQMLTKDLVNKTGSLIDNPPSDSVEKNNDIVETSSKAFSEGVTAREERLRKLKELLKEKQKAVDDLYKL